MTKGIVSASSEIWQIDWSNHLPRKLTESISMTKVGYAEGSRYAKKYFPTIYNHSASEQIFFERPTPHLADHRARYYNLLGDFFVMKEGKNFVGMAICTVLDWGSYNLRNVAILPEYQEHGIYTAFWAFLLEIMGEYKVGRIEGDVSPTNHHHLHVLNKISAMVTSLVISERWGVLLHLTKFLNEEDEERFGNLFSSTFASDMKQNAKHGKLISELKREGKRP